MVCMYRDLIYYFFLPLTLSGIFFCAGILICFNALKLKQLHYFNQIYFKGFF